MRKGLYQRIREKKKELNEAILKFGLNSPETIKLSTEIDELTLEYYEETKVKEFPQGSRMPKYFHKSYNALKVFTLKNGIYPSVVEWNKYADNNGYLNSISLEYITMMDWDELKRRINMEINTK